MAPSREIEKLQRRWQENPLGLTFAPLAEAYRKEGMYADALDLLEIGLSQHPNYVPAHIVRGRCLIDTQADAEAERAFSRVTELDPENVIALKSLAEIAERAGRYSDAAAKLERLLEFDRNNDEAEAQLDRVRSFLAMPSPGTIPDSVAGAPVSGQAVISNEPPSEPVVAREEPHAEIVEASRVEIETFQPVELTAAPGSEYQLPDAPDTLESGVARTDYVEKSPDLVELTEASPAPEPPAEVELIPEPAQTETAVEMGLPEPAHADAAVEMGPAVGEFDPPSGEQEELPEEPVDAPAIEASAPPPPEDAEVESAESEPDLVVTESMAEVFIRQGHRELALAVYSQLASRDPDNQRIRQAIEQLSSERKPAPAVGLPAYSAVITGGQSVRSFFERLLSATRPGGAPEAAGLSLGAVFGDEATAAPAAPEPGQPAPSFDEFYADAPGPGATPPAAASAGTGSTDDIEEFNSWLRGLKR